MRVSQKTPVKTFSKNDILIEDHKRVSAQICLSFHKVDIYPKIIIFIKCGLLNKIELSCGYMQLIIG